MSTEKTIIFLSSHINWDIQNNNRHFSLRKSTWRFYRQHATLQCWFKKQAAFPDVYFTLGFSSFRSCNASWFFLDLTR